MANKKEYIQQNQKFLRDIATDPQTQTLPKGILYQVIKSGDGPSPTLSSVVCVYYTGALINGKIFDDNTNQSYPDALRLHELITGWQIASPECMWVTNGASTFRPKWDMERKQSMAFPKTQRSYLR